MADVFLIWHTNPTNDDVKLIGVFDSLESASEVKDRYLLKSGFMNFPDGFEISKYTINKECWTEGFIQVDIE